MENTILDNDNFDYGDMTITPEIKSFLKETAKWSKFLSIVGFVMIGLFLIMAIVMSVFMGSMPETGAMGAVGGGFIVVIYALVGLIYLFPLLYLYRFATNMKMALNNDDQSSLSTSFENLKSCYKFMGIFTAVIVGFYVVSIVFTLLLGGAAAFM